MGERTGFNQQLEIRSKRFTYFVPRNKAWTNSEQIYPNALRKLISDDYNFEVKEIEEKRQNLKGVYGLL